MKEYTKVIFELSTPGKIGYALPELDVEAIDLSSTFSSNVLRDNLDLPEVSEFEVVRHHTNLSKKNMSVDANIYPLGSCTMKYNPKINEDMANLSGFSGLHPLVEANMAQGALELMYNLAEHLSEIGGFAQTTLQPAAGAHGEYTGLMLIKAYHNKYHANQERKYILVPDSAHGTNPSTAAVAGFEMLEIKSNEDGSVNVEDLEKVIKEQQTNVAGLMLTNPSTLGLFEKNITKINDLIHSVDGLIYYDGANMNAIMGKVRPGDMGFDVMHYNLHKTMSTPHGGGGPGAGPVAVNEKLQEFLPKPIISKDADNNYYLDYNRPDSIGQLKAFYGHFGVLVRAYTYILTLGPAGLTQASEFATLNANYLKELVKDNYQVAVDNVCMHEFVLAGLKDKSSGVSTLDVAKRIIDYGYHPPTIYFPLIVEEALMIEPTETESRESIEAYAQCLNEIAQEAKDNPEIVKSAPNTTPCSRVDEVYAARNLVLTFQKEGNE